MLTVYKASAGSGKTFSLAYEYIKLVLGIKGHDGNYRLVRADDPSREPRRHRFILAITFTNAATEEMKARIIKELDAVARLDSSSRYVGSLCKEFGCTAPQLGAAASQALSELLLDYDHFNVSTIDAFFQSVLRTFSHDLDLQGDYALSLDTDDVLQQSLSQLLDKVNFEQPDADIENWINSFTSMRMDNSRNFNVFDRNGSILAQLSGTAKCSLSEDFKPYASATEEYLQDPQKSLSFYRWCNDTVDAMYVEAAQALSAAHAAVDSNGGPDVLYRYMRNALYDSFPRIIAEKTGELTPTQCAWVESGQIPENRIVCSLQSKKLPGCFEIAAALEPSLRKAVLMMIRAVRNGNALRRMADAVWNLRFAGYASRELNNYMRENNTLLIDKSTELISGLLGKGDVPFIYERIGTYLRHLLIDEFQDTSRSQWSNLKPLVENALGYGHDCLIIGDVKQAIYRFRNSDSSILDHEVENDDFPGGKHRTRGTNAADNTNYRSSRDIVRFNNTVFRHMADELGISAYDGVVQDLRKPGGDTPEDQLRQRREFESAYIRISFSAAGKRSANNMDEDDTDALGEMVEQIRRQHDSGYRWKDILVLARGRETVRKAVDYLRSCDPPIPVISEDSLLLSNSPAVRSVMATLALVLSGVAGGSSGKDEKYATRAEATNMLSRFNYFSSRNPADMAAAIMQAADTGNSSAELYDIVERIRLENPTNIVATLEAIIYHTLGDITVFPAPVPAPGRKPRVPRTDYKTRGISVCGAISSEQAYIAALIDRAIEHLGAPDPSPAAFLESYTRHLDTWAIAVPAATDAVVAMTIHKSKGLEAKCVHIPNLNWQIYRTTAMWLPIDTFEHEPIPDAPPALRIEVSDNDVLMDSSFGTTAVEAAANRKAEIADSFNMAYVAMTRARRELCMWGTASLTDSQGTISKLLFNTLRAGGDTGGDPRLIDLNSEAVTAELLCTENPKGESKLASALYEYGAPTMPAPQGAEKRDDEGTLANPSEQPMPDLSVIYRDDARMFTAVEDVLSPDDEDDIPIPDDDEDGSADIALMQEAAIRGNNLHAILAEMNSEDDLERAAGIVARIRTLSPALKNEYVRTLREAFAQSEQARSWFAPYVIAENERSIYNPDKDETLRPDRIVRMPDGSIVVIDYKFTTEQRPGHAYQLREYIQLVRVMDGVRPRGFLWYPDLNIIKEV